MNGTCAKCGISIKNIVNIGGKTYGTSCAEIVLGIRLPQGFTGDGDDFKAYKAKEVEAKHLAVIENDKRFKAEEARTQNGWNINVFFTKAYKAASSDWEQDFVSSCASQVSATILKYLKNGLSFDDARRDWNSNYMGSFPYRNYDLNDTFDNLSDKQKSILDRIASN